MLAFLSRLYPGTALWTDSNQKRERICFKPGGLLRWAMLILLRPPRSLALLLINVTETSYAYLHTIMKVFRMN